MKKFISLMLAGLLSASLFAVGAAADSTPTTKTGVVGGTDGVGENDFKTPVTDEGNTINVKVEDVTHKYAVDITFSFDDLSIGGLVWDVNSMKYEFKSGEKLKDTTRTITVSNRSDLPVQAYATVTDTVADDGLTVAMQTVTENPNDGSSAAKKKTVAKATAGTTANGTASTGTLTVELSSENWGAVAQYYIDKQQAEAENSDKAHTYPVATVTVFISKVG